MPVSRALRNLLKLRNLEAEQHGVVLKSAMSELHTLQEALARSRVRRTAACVAVPELLVDGLDRKASLLQQDAEARIEQYLAVRRDEASARVEDARIKFVQKRTEQRKAELLVRAAQDREAADIERRLQRTIDEQHLRGGAGKKR